MATQQPGTETQGTEQEKESKEELPVKKSSEEQQGGAVQKMRAPASKLLQRLRRGGASQLDPWTANPFALIRRMSDDIDRMFGDFLSQDVFDDFARAEPMVWAPRIDVFERGDELVVRADLPGIRKEDLNIEVRGNNLVLEGERKYEHEDESGGYYRSEVEYGTFRRVIALPEGANVDDAKATFEDGILELRIKQPQPRGRRIEIGGGGEQKAGEMTGEEAATGEETPKVH